ncbi:MAG: TIGR03087 family PEP-CTERM/XrtA system glycosyltransferase [Deltaproteobacteria bacterium]|jgi:sugar transferase (PEP-CTERM/EpsH1 system associated)|nr:TIGR03087 family PEP-CTERM/XrtA system glycosyltransferase [Deltaproteobacteria bacterium]
MKKDLLFIVHRIPFPPDKGDKIRTYHMLRYLAERYRVTVVCMVDDPDDIQHIETLRALVYQVHYRVRTTKMMKLWAIGALFTGKPFTLQCFYSKHLQQEIDTYLDQYDPVSILCFCSSSAEYIFRSRHSLKTLQKKVLLNDLIDVDSEKWGDYAEKHRGLMRWLYRREEKLLLPCEQRIIDSFDRTFLVSEEEKTILASQFCVDKVEAISNGVDLDYFSPLNVSKEQYPTAPCKLVFTGAMDYWPNVEGAVWFAEKVFPAVKKEFADAVFCVAGRNPTDVVLELTKISGIEVTGTVADMRDHLSTATICVVPLLIARGIQNKVLEGMAMQKPVIATTGAATGIKAIDGEEIVVVDDEMTMAQEIISLLKDSDRQCSLGLKARAYVEREHSWDSHLCRLTELIEEGTV